MTPFQVMILILIAVGFISIEMILICNNVGARQYIKKHRQEIIEIKKREQEQLQEREK